MRKYISIIIAMVLVLSAISFAFASENAVRSGRSLSFSGTTAYIDAYVRNTGSECSISAELWQGGTMVAYWDDLGDDSASVSGTVSGCTSGLTYTLYVYATVDGNTVNINPISRVCP